MRVLFIASGNKTGKPGIVVQNQANSLKELGIEIDFYLVKGKGLIGYLKNLYPLWKHIKYHPSSLIHSHYSLSALLVSIALIFLPFKPHIVSLMGSDTKLKGVFKSIVKLFSRFFWTITIVKSKQMLSDSGIHNALIIPNGVDIKKIEQLVKESNPKKAGFKNNSTKTILFAADPSRKSKNYSLAHQAMKNINAILKISYNKTHANIINEILHSDVLLITSRWEGSPNIIKEAMACNCPIVSTEVGDIRWLFGNEPGHFIANFDPADVAEKINQALEFSREKVRTNGKQRIIQLGLDNKIVAKKIIKVYKENLN